MSVPKKKPVRPPTLKRPPMTYRVLKDLAERMAKDLEAAGVESVALSEYRSTRTDYPPEIVQEILTSDLSQAKIAKMLNDRGIKITQKTVGNILRKHRESQ